jgi:hypothetical protein
MITDVAGPGDFSVRSQLDNEELLLAIFSTLGITMLDTARTALCS